ALGEAESRSDQRTLLAVGADPRVRRRITAARAGVIALLGGVLAVPAGLLPVWGLLASRGAPLVVPVPEAIAAVLVLPVVAIGAAWLLGRPIPEWGAFRAERA
ncbi:MAG: FtsX-like permease family protein, partial [Candidatus Limnocylindrales bacterium]